MMPTELKAKIKERIALGLNHGLKSIEEIIKPDSALYNEMITFKSQYNDLNRIASQNLIRYEQIEIGLNKIRSGLIGLVDRLENNDLNGEKTQLPQLKNAELQFRKNNFFELLDIHYTNLQNVKVKITTSSGDSIYDDIREGRDAIRYIYTDIFKYDFNQPIPRDKELVNDIRAYSKVFFQTRIQRMEVYMKTVKFILEYILEEEMEQAFFLKVFKSILSSYELVCIFYYNLGQILPKFDEILKKADLFDQTVIELLLKKEHLNEYESE